MWVHQETDINGSSQRESCINGKSDTKPMRSTTSRQELRDVELGALWRQNRWWICSTGSLQPPVTEFTREGPEIFYQLHKTRLRVIMHLHRQVCLISRLQKFTDIFFKGSVVKKWCSIYRYISTKMDCCRFLSKFPQTAVQRAGKGGRTYKIYLQTATITSILIWNGLRVHVPGFAVSNHCNGYILLFAHFHFFRSRLWLSVLRLF